LKRVAGENGKGLAKNFVTSWAASPQIVVVERGKIVVNKRIGMQHFERCAKVFHAAWKFARHGSCRFHTQNRPDAFSSSEDAVPDGLMNGAWSLVGRWQQALKG